MIVFDTDQEKIKSDFTLMSTLQHCRWGLGAPSCSNQAKVVCQRVRAISPYNAEL